MVLLILEGLWEDKLAKLGAEVGLEISSFVFLSPFFFFQASYHPMKAEGGWLLPCSLLTKQGLLPLSANDIQTRWHLCSPFHWETSQADWKLEKLMKYFQRNCLLSLRYLMSKLPSLYFLLSEIVPEFFLFSPWELNKTCDLESFSFSYNDCLSGRFLS